MNILQLIARDSFITVNKELIKQVGLEEAILVGELASEFDYWSKREGLTEDGYFFSTQENIEDKTTLSPYQQRKALKKLKEMKLVDVSVRGIPAKRYIKLNEENILKIFTNKMSNNLISSCQKTSQLEAKKLNGNNNIINNNINNNNILLTDSKESVSSRNKDVNIYDSLEKKEIIYKEEKADEWEHKGFAPLPSHQHAEYPKCTKLSTETF